MKCTNRPLSTFSVIAVFIIAQIPFTLGAQWTSSAYAPMYPGEYTIVIRATYTESNVSGTHTMDLLVYELAENSPDLEIIPLFPIVDEPPITLRYKIEVGGVAIDELLESNITLFFLYMGSPVIFSEAPPLARFDDIFETIADVPFRGDYQAVISVEALKDSTVHTGTFVSEFFSPRPSPDLFMSAFLRERVFIPNERFSVYANLSFHGQNIGGMNIYRANLGGEQYSLDWDPVQEIYEGGLRAPREEGIFELMLYVLDQGYTEIKMIYVADTDLSKSETCPITDTDYECDNEEEVRRCVDDYKRGRSFYTQNQLIQCFETGMGIKPMAFCNENMDLDGDNHLDSDDLTLLQAVIELGEEKRQDYISCGDYDNDGDVDEDDAVCLSKVLAMEWYGTLDGGYCLDIDLDTPLAGDLDGDLIISDEDSVRMDLMMTAAMVVEPLEEYLSIADFNQDGSIDEEDRECQDYFLGLTLDNPAGYTPGRVIPSNCLKIYHLDRCKGIRGDLNGDSKIDEIDLILIMLIRKGYIEQINVDMACADVNNDGSITQEDELCIQNYISGNAEYYYACLECSENIPREYRNPVEICADGYDNDCDGLVDRTSLDPAADKCQCNSLTPCDMVEDSDGGSVPGVSDGMIRVCRDLSWDSTGYIWIDQMSLVCSQDKSCEWYECGGIRKTCSNEGSGPKWFLSLPRETNEPPLCQDGWDNDCSGGDERCEVEKDDTMLYLMIGMMGMQLMTSMLTPGGILNPANKPKPEPPKT